MVSVWERTAYLAAAAGLICSSSACGRSSKWANLEVRATFAVDGQVQQASTVWRTRIRDTFPSGSIETTDGAALVLKVGLRQYVFGTFAIYNDRQIRESSTATAVDSFVFASHQRRHGAPIPGNKADERNNAIAEVTGVRVPICEHKPAERIQPPCLLFVTFQDPNNPRSIRRVDVGSHFSVGNNDVIISSVTVGFVATRPATLSTLPDLPWLRRAPNSLVATLPAGPDILFSHSIYVSDFRRP